MTQDVPVEFFESVVGIEVAITGALLFQIRFFESARLAGDQDARIPTAWLRLAMAIVIGTTVFGSLYAIASHGQRNAALGVAVGLLLSVLPILYRILPPLSSRADTAVTTAGLVLYVIAVWVIVALLNG